MRYSRFLMSALLGCAGLLAGATSAHAQGYLYGYYYPDEGKFVTFEMRPHYQYNVSPESMARFTGYGARPASVPVFTAPVPTEAGVRVILPDTAAKVWFDGAPTKSTGTDRQYQTPALAPGSSNRYHVKASWMQNGREVTQERDIFVTPGQITTVEFARAEKAPAPSIDRKP